MDRATCPHCQRRYRVIGTPEDCCVCRGRGVLELWGQMCAAVGNIWARPGCACLACRTVGPGYGRTL